MSRAQIRPRPSKAPAHSRRRAAARSALYAIGGGVINATGATTITTTGGAVAGAPISAAYGIVADGLGSEVNLQGPTTINASGGAFYFADTANTGATGTINISGPLTLTSSGTSAAALTLSGPGASFSGTGGGTITTAGTAIAFDNATNATATFDNFTISNASGDLIFADPSNATINFNSTTADAGAGTLLDATNGSNITLNSNNSTITGVMTTDATSTSAVSLTNGSTWTMTGSSNLTSLSANNSAVVFSPPTNGAYKTLTVGSYSGNGATLTMNAALGGPGSLADHLTLASSPTGATSLVSPQRRRAGGANQLVRHSADFDDLGRHPRQCIHAAKSRRRRRLQYNLSGSGNDQEMLVSTPATTTAQATSSVASVGDSRRDRRPSRRASSTRFCSAPRNRSIARAAVQASPRSARSRSARTAAGRSTGPLAARRLFVR